MFYYLFVYSWGVLALNAMHFLGNERNCGVYTYKKSIQVMLHSPAGLHVLEELSTPLKKKKTGKLDSISNKRAESQGYAEALRKACVSVFVRRSLIVICIYDYQW